MEVRTTRFGSIEISANDRVCFPCGMPGFEDCRDWVLLIERPERSVGWLQSVSWPDLAMPVVNPQYFVPEYEIRLDPLDLLPIGLDNAADLQILAVVARHGDVLTANLKAPLAINMRRRLGVQLLNTVDCPVDFVVKNLSTMIKKSA